MKNIITIVLCLMVSLIAQAQLKVSDTGIRKISDMSTDVGEGLGTANNFSRHVEWPAYKGNQTLVRIQFAGLSLEEIKSIAISTDPADPIRTELRKINGLNEYWVFVPTNNIWIELRHPKFGSTRVILPQNMENKDTYLVETGITRMVDITVDPLLDPGQKMRVELDNYEIKKCPAVFNNVIEGKHLLRFKNGGKNIERMIDVTALDNRFMGDANPDFDFRNKKNIKIISQEKEASILIDGKLVSKSSTVEVELPYGPHTISAVLPNGTKDTRELEVKAETLPVVYLDPIGLKDFEVVGIYGGHSVPAAVSVAGLPKQYQPDDMYESLDSHTFRLPVGSSYNFRMSYYGSSGNKQIKVTPDMSPTQQIVIRGRKEFRWPWDIEMPERFIGITAGYVMKQLATTGEGILIKTNGVWNHSWDKWLHGIQIGMNVQPQTSFGLGLYSGLFFDFFYSKSDEGYQGYNEVLDEYLEMDLYMPIHLWYQVPIVENIAVAVHGGFSFSCSLVGEFCSNFMKDIFSSLETDEYGNSLGSTEETWNDFWGETGFPKQFNAMLDLGLKLRLGRVQLGIQWSKGLNDHKTFSEYGAFKTVQNRRTFTVSINF